jgi:multidrug resistance protein MdtO
MTIVTATIDRLGQDSVRLWSLVRNELAPFPGRVNAVARFLLSSTLVIVCSMALQVPFLSLSLIAVFFTAQENTVLTRLTGIVLVIGVTVAVLAAILHLMFTIDHPMLRVLGACAIAFCGMYFLRISKLGPIGFLLALVVVYAQSLVDSYDNAEALTRGMLWVWVAMTYAIAVTVAVNLLFLPARPVDLLEAEYESQLGDVIRQIDARLAVGPVPPLDIGRVERGVLVLHRHLSFATMGDAGYARDKAIHLMHVAAVDRLHIAAAHLARLPARELSADERAQLLELRAACAALRQSLGTGAPFIGPTPAPADVEPLGALGSILREMAHALLAAANADAPPPTAAPDAPKGGLAPDAFSNPAYARFALKTVLAAMIAYVFYTAVQWPGIHTAMLTCIIVALPSLGATTHKGIARLVGCALGSLVTLAATVFVVPHIETITGLLAMALPIIAVGAWIAAGSARSNYVGVQFMFAFALAQLGHFGPVIDLTEIRDRLVGILIGLGISMVVFTVLWPEREGAALTAALARLLKSMAAFSCADSAAAGAARLQAWALLSQNRELQARVAFEPTWPEPPDTVAPDMTTILAQAQETLFAQDSLRVLISDTEGALPASAASALAEFQAATARQLASLAEQVSTAQQAGAGAESDPLAGPLATLDRMAAGQGMDRERLAALVAAAHAVHERIQRLGEHVRRYAGHASGNPRTRS